MGESKNRGGLGFRELEHFNLTLLAKQCWRLMKNPTANAIDIMREKYYKHKQFKNAKMGLRPSLI